MRKRCLLWKLRSMGLYGYGCGVVELYGRVGCMRELLRSAGDFDFMRLLN